MKRKKDFDCVEMKDRIQRQLLEEWKGLSDAEIFERIRRNLETSDQPIARWWRRVRARRATKDA